MLLQAPVVYGPVWRDERRPGAGGPAVVEQVSLCLIFCRILYVFYLFISHFFSLFVSFRFSSLIRSESRRWSQEAPAWGILLTAGEDESAKVSPQLLVILTEVVLRPFRHYLLLSSNAALRLPLGS